MSRPASVSPGRRAAFAALAALAGLALALAGCDGAPPERELQYRATPPVAAPAAYRFAVHPLHNPKLLSAAYQPLLDHLNGRLDGVRLELEASRDYAAYEAKIRARGPEFLLPNPWQAIQANAAGYRVIAMAGDAADFRGLIIVRKDSTVVSPADLRGQTVAYPSPTALAACVMPQYFLHRAGLDINRDIRNTYVGSQQSAIMNVHLGRAAAAGTWPAAWRLFQRDHPQEAAGLKVQWETPPLMNNAVMVRDDVPPAVADAVRRLLLELADAPGGPAILAGMATARFHAADDASYDKVRDYIAAFEREVRPVEVQP